MNGCEDQQNSIGGPKWEGEHMKMIKKFEASCVWRAIIDQMENCDCKGTWTALQRGGGDTIHIVI